LFPIRANVAPYKEFIQHHPKFFVLGDYDYPEDWLLRKLLDDGATVQILGSTDTSFKSQVLYAVEFKEATQATNKPTD
ncbi:MAG: hypothetical protein ABI142_11750, partial [Bryocella sp.]